MLNDARSATIEHTSSDGDSFVLVLVSNRNHAMRTGIPLCLVVSDVIVICIRLAVSDVIVIGVLTCEHNRYRNRFVVAVVVVLTLRKKYICPILKSIPMLNDLYLCL